MGNFSLVELIWTALAFAGMYFSGLNAWEAASDFRALSGRQNGRRRIATDHVRHESSRIVIFFLYTVIGIWAGLTAPPPTDGVSILSVILVGTSAILVVNSILDRRSRVYLMTYGSQARDQDGMETQNQLEDRLFGLKRRELEDQHTKDADEA